jgi:hypothetical protein
MTEARRLPNRVDPFGKFFAVDARGSLMGNRGGRFHAKDAHMVTTRPYASRQWICCRLSFKGRHRTVWGDGYTELFFSDECAALAAGHRPCFECRRTDALSFAAAWGRAQRTAPPAAPQMDAVLHAERLVPGRSYAKRLYRMPAMDLPDGVMAAVGTVPYLVRNGMLHRWSFTGYSDEPEDLPSGSLDVLTPPSIVQCLSAGYMPVWD